MAPPKVYVDETVEQRNARIAKMQRERRAIAKEESDYLTDEQVRELRIEISREVIEEMTSPPIHCGISHFTTRELLDALLSRLGNIQCH